MSLTQEAVQEIAELGAKSEAVKIDELNDVDFKAAILPKGTNIFSLEQFQKYRNQFNGDFSTHNIQSFVEYNKEQQGENPTCFILSDSMHAKTVFDLGNAEQAGHCKHKAYLALTKTAEYEGLLYTIGRIDQKQFAEFIEDWNDNITCHHDGDESSIDITNKQAISAIRKVKIEAKVEAEHEASDFKGTKSVFESVEAKAGNYQDRLPSRIVFKCSPYDELSVYEFTIRISILTGRDKPFFSLRIVNHAKQTDEMAEEFMSIITEKLADTSIKTYIGDFKS